MIADFNENSSGCECQLSSMIQETSRGIESKRDETSRSWEMEIWKNIKQKKSKGHSEVFSIIEKRA